MGFLTGKKALITGLASDRSIAYGIARAMRDQGAELVLTYQGDKLKGRVEKMGADLGATAVLPLDVAEDAQIDALFTSLGEHWDQLDVLVHAIGYAPREALSGGYLDSISRDASRIAQPPHRSHTPTPYEKHRPRPVALLIHETLVHI